MSLRSLNNPNLYKGPNSSEDFNKRNQAMIKDMNSLYVLLNQNEKDIHDNMDIVLRENFFLQNAVTSLSGEIARLREIIEQNHQSETGESYSVFLQNFYDGEFVKNNEAENPSSIDRVHGVVTPLATNVSSKLSHETDTGHVILPHGLEVFVKETKDTERDAHGQLVYYDIDNSDIKSIVDKKKDTFWVRTVSFPTKDAVNEVFGEIHMRLPLEGMNNLYANTLTIHPYPEGSMRISDIQYKGIGNQWNRLETYPTEIVDGEEVPIPIHNSRKLFFQFSQTEVTELRIFYSQPYWLENEGMNNFAYGFQGINLEHRTYTEKDCEFTTELDISGRNLIFSEISEPEVVPADGATKDLNNLVEHKLYYDEHLSDEFSFNETILPAIDKVYVKTILKKEGNSIPVLKEIHIPYLFKERN